MSIRIVDMHKDCYVPGDNEILIKVDRTNKVLGNQFVMNNESERDTVIDQYNVWLRDKIASKDTDVINELNRIRYYAKTMDVALGCWCYPKRCHAESILRELKGEVNEMQTINMNNVFEECLPNSTICITTNGVVKNDGNLVMGKGVALEAQNYMPSMPYILGTYVKAHGNRCFNVGMVSSFAGRNISFASFPTKHDYNESASLSLIQESALQIKAMADKFKWTNVYIPAPGCGLGQLEWNDVEAVLRPILDSRFFIVFRNTKANADTTVVNMVSPNIIKPAMIDGIVDKRASAQPKKVFKCIVAGSRGFDSYAYLEQSMDYMLSSKIKAGYEIEIISGNAHGADELGEKYAKARGYNLTCMPADWNAQGKKAGFMRNEAMAKYASDKESTEVIGGCCVYWDGTSKGTQSMITLCAKYSLPCKIFKYLEVRNNG